MPSAEFGFGYIKVALFISNVNLLMLLKHNLNCFTINPGCSIVDRDEIVSLGHAGLVFA
jgi:hypothetical protein